MKLVVGGGNEGSSRRWANVNILCSQQALIIIIILEIIIRVHLLTGDQGIVKPSCSLPHPSPTTTTTIHLESDHPLEHNWKHLIILSLN